MTPFFQFETDFVESLRCIPLVVRYKLDRCGVKLKLQHWHQLSHGERQQLVDQEVETPGAIAAYRALIHRQVLQYAPIPPADLPIPDRFPWQDLTVVPESVQVQGNLLGISLSLSQWQGLTPLQRFALVKLSRSGHENRNFRPACQEFGLMPEDSVG